MTKAFQSFSPETFASIVQDLEGRGMSKKSGGSAREEARLVCEVTPSRGLFPNLCRS